MNSTTDRIREFLARYDAFMLRAETPSAVWLAEATALLREMAPPVVPGEGAAATGMTVISEDIYQSSNGDRWRLIRDTTSGRAFVRHDPDPSSGGRATHVPVDEFLARAGNGPEHIALRRLLDKSDESRLGGENT